MTTEFVAIKPLNRRQKNLGKGLLASGCLLLSLGATPQTDASAAPEDLGEMGFVLTEFAPATYQGKENCPDGLARTVRENYLLSLPTPERDRLSRPENDGELGKLWRAYALGSDPSTNICNNMELFDRPPQMTSQGKLAYGLDLDGDAMGGQPAASSCAHSNYISPDGEKGIDNEFYRVQGCTRFYRGVDGVSGDLIKQLNLQLASGEQSMVLKLRGVDNLVDDPEVEVILATTRDQPILDANQKFIEGTSFTVADRRWRNVLRGRIKGGVLTTEPNDIRLSQRWGFGGVRGSRAEWDLREGRLRLKFEQDGTVRGLLGAYLPLENAMQVPRLGGIGMAETGGVDCAAMYAAMKRHLDGLRDPKTGQCTGISTANEIVGVRAFIQDLPQNSGPMADAGLQK